MTDSSDPIEAADEAVEPTADAVEAPPRRPRIQVVERPARLAKAAHRAQLEPEVKAPSAAKFHARRSLVPTSTKVSRGPLARSFEDDASQVVELGDRVPAGPEPELGDGLGSVEGQA